MVVAVLVGEYLADFLCLFVFLVDICLIIDALVNYNVIRCVNEEISGFAMGCVIKSSIVLIESIVFGSLTLRLYQKHDDVSDYGHL